MKTILGITIILIIPLFGLIGYLVFQNKKKVDPVPTVELLLIGITYSIFLLMILSIALDGWSAITSLAMAYLIFIAPILMGFLAYRTRNKHQQSSYYKWTYVASLSYFVIIIITFIFGSVLS